MKHVSLPQVFYIKVPNRLLGPKMPDGFTAAILHGMYAREGQAVLTHLLLESGAHWSGVPLHEIYMNYDDITTDEKLSQQDLQPWGCMGTDLVISSLDYLEGLKVKPRFIDVDGRHTGIILDWNGKFSRHPQEHKPLSLIHLRNGSFALLPNNYFSISDPHFVEPSELVKLYKRGEKVYWER
jgi:hypothetical protein